MCESVDTAYTLSLLWPVLSRCCGRRGATGWERSEVGRLAGHAVRRHGRRQAELPALHPRKLRPLLRGEQGEHPRIPIGADPRDDVAIARGDLAVVLARRGPLERGAHRLAALLARS